MAIKNGATSEARSQNGVSGIEKVVPKALNVTGAGHKPELEAMFTVGTVMTPVGGAVVSTGGETGGTKGLDACGVGAEPDGAGELVVVVGPGTATGFGTDAVGAGVVELVVVVVVVPVALGPE